MGHKLALVVGNTTYSDARFPPLSTPAQDVNQLVQTLKDPHIGAFDEVDSLINETQTVVTRAVARFFAGKMRDDLLLLYFSGHGVLDEDGQLHLALTDTEWDTPRASALSADFVATEMDRGRSSRVVLILDCCHSGAFARGAKGALGASVGTKTAFEGNGRGRFVMTATDATQYAWEGTQLINVGPQQYSGTSVFTRFLVEGLQDGAADLDRDGFITVRDLNNYVYDRVQQQKLNQTPSLWTYKEQGDLVIASNPKPVLPEELLDAIRSSYTSVRRGAVDELERLAGGHHAGVSLLAQDALQGLVQDDSRQVTKAAAAALRKLGIEPKLRASSTQMRPLSPEELAQMRRQAIAEVRGGQSQGTTQTAGPSRQNGAAAANIFAEWNARAGQMARSAGARSGTYWRGAARGIQNLWLDLEVLTGKLAVSLATSARVQVVGASVLVVLLAGGFVLYRLHKKTANHSQATAHDQTTQSTQSPLPGPVENSTTGGASDAASSASSKLPDTAATSPSTPDPAGVGGVPAGRIQVADMSPHLLKRVPPTYPPAARSANIQGTVVLAAVIEKDGQVGQLDLVKGNSVLAPAAIEAVRQWRYQPYLVGGNPAEVETQIAVAFRLKAAPVAKPLSGSAVITLQTITPGVVPPVQISLPPPEYTDQARDARLQGTVILLALIGSDGRIGDLTVTHAVGMGLDEKAIEAVRRWKFQPAQKKGKPVAAQVRINLDFVLH